ncbi:hypothetical protein QVD17_27739 [Tagetes erecta]|uniref:Caffeoyl-CoA O-methyltransferase n=1 Tax=Tagetes erecta TaxID=13708 RepID=A0AAD8NRC8_TARER|nr:hypothetical protein QVD17_27739 [Tagetes erecta]
MEPTSVLQTHDLYKYILETTVYPSEPEPLKELRAASAILPNAFMGTGPDAGRMIQMLLKISNAKRTIEVGVFTGYSLLLTALTIPDDGKIVAIDIDRKAYEIGLPVIQKAGVEHKIEFIESKALSALDKMLENPGNEGSFDFAFVDANKDDYINYHERIVKLLKVNGIVAYDNTLFRGAVAQPESCIVDIFNVPRENTEKLKFLKAARADAIAFNKSLAVDPRIEMCLLPFSDGLTICRRLY